MRRQHFVEHIALMLVSLSNPQQSEMFVKQLIVRSACVTLFLALAACEAKVKDEGKLPDVDVDVSATPGKLPEVDVEPFKVSIGEKQVNVPVPEVDVTTTQKRITVPDIDVTTPSDKTATEKAQER